MGSFANYLENKILDHILKTASYTVPTNIYFALSTADPTDAGSGLAEPSGNGYARKTCNVWNAASVGQTANTNAVTFDVATGSWGTISHFAAFDSLSGGNMLFHGALSVAKAIATGDTASFAAGAVTITLD